jgi:hypothetical protein
MLVWDTLALIVPAPFAYPEDIGHALHLLRVFSSSL